MSEKIKAADDIRNLARMFKNMVSVADQLEQIGQLEQVQAESAAAVAKARAELSDANAKTDAAMEQLRAVEAETAERMNKAKEAIDAQLSEANLEAQSIVAQSKLTAEALENKASAQYERMIEQTHRAKLEADTACDRISKSIEDGEVELANQKAELERLTGAIAGARDQILKLMGE